YFGSGAPSLVSSFATLNVDCISVDWRTPIADAWKVVGERAIQGNLDPATLLAPQDIIEREAVRILSTVGNRPGFIFNLGHGILKETPVENVEFLVKIVKGWSL
ncbi:MAG: uroporphyrinogen decarboxylase, partial [Thermoguttaceae bacterium]|nr:uroporphyrinogen decarboxylase [Thermoguttaceae bacterium]